MSETIAAWLVDRRLVGPGISAHAHARRVHYGKQHLWLITFVILGVKLAIEGVLSFVHAVGADPTCLFSANFTLPDRRLVLAQEAHALAADAPPALIYHTQLQIGRSAEVVGVLLPDHGRNARKPGMLVKGAPSGTFAIVGGGQR